MQWANHAPVPVHWETGKRETLMRAGWLLQVDGLSSAEAFDAPCQGGVVAVILQWKPGHGTSAATTQRPDVVNIRTDTSPSRWTVPELPDDVPHEAFQWIPSPSPYTTDYPVGDEAEIQMIMRPGR
jgi:hypothetical protein